MDVNMTTRKRDCSRELHLSATVRVVPAVVAIDIAKVKLASKIMTFNCFMTTTYWLLFMQFYFKKYKKVDKSD